MLFRLVATIRSQIRTGWLAYRLWDRHDCIDLSAAFAYHTLQSTFPILLISLSIASRILGGDDGLTDQVTAFSAEILPPSALPLFQATLLRLYGQQAGAGLLGVFVLLVTASNAYLTLKRGSDRLWGWRVPVFQVSSSHHVKPLMAVRRFLFQRLKAFSVVLSAGLFLVFGQISSNLRLYITRIWQGLFNLQTPWAMEFFLPLPVIVEVLISMAVSSVVALVLLRILSSRMIQLAPLVRGSILIGTALTFLNIAVGRSIISLGVRFQAYGVIGSVLVLTLWVWMLGLIFYYGLAWTVVVARHRPGGNPHPARLGS